MSGALGNIPGYTYDPIKKRYFFAPIAPTPSASASSSSAAGRGRITGDGRSQSTSGNKANRRDKKPVDKREARQAAGKADPQQTALGKRRKVEEDERAEEDRQLVDRRRLNLYIAQRSNLDRLSRWRVLDQRLVQRQARSNYYSSLTPVDVLQPERSNQNITTLAALPNQDNCFLTGSQYGSITAIMDDQEPCLDYMIDLDHDNDAYHDTDMDSGGNTGGGRGGRGGARMGWGEASGGTRRKYGTRVRRFAWNTLHFKSKITGIHCEKDHYLATTFGPQPLLLFSPSYPPYFPEGTGSPINDQPSLFWQLTKVKDVWSLSGKDGAITIGANGKVLHMGNMKEFQGNAAEVRTVGGSDALCVEQVNVYEAFVGLRSGIIGHIDFRLPPEKAFSTRARSTRSIVNLKVIENSFGAGRGIVASSLNDELNLFDTRFSPAEPAVKYKGHLNTYRDDMAMCIDQTESTLFAYSLDHRMRAWDIPTGQSLSSTPDRRGSGLLNHKFDEIVTGMHVTHSGSVYVAEGADLKIFGRKDPPITGSLRELISE